MPKEAKDPKPATRTSRRLRSSQEPDASPLKEYVPPKRKTRTNSSTKADATESKQDLYTPIAEKQKEVEQDSTKNVSTTEINDFFTRPLLFPHVPAILAFEREASNHNSRQLLNSMATRAKIADLIMTMTDDQKVDLLIAQRAKIASQEQQMELQEELLERATQSLEAKERSARNIGRQLSMASKRSHKEPEKQAPETATSNAKSTSPASRKRPAPMEEGAEQEEPPARRVKVTHTPEVAESKKRLSAIMETSSDAEEANNDEEQVQEEQVQEQQDDQNETTTPEPEQEEERAEPLQTPSRWIAWIPTPIARIFTAGGTPAPAPRTAPVRRIANASRPSHQATPTRSEQPRRASTDASQQNTSSSGKHDTNGNSPQREAPELTAPQTAPVQRGVSKHTGPPRRKFQDRLKSMDATAAKRKAAAEEKQSIEASQQTGQKRKIRVDDLPVIPPPAPGVIGMNEAYFFGDDSDGEVYVTEERVIADGITPPPAKRAKISSDDSPARKRAWPTSTLADVSPISKIPTASLTADPHRAQPYTGTMFADSPSIPSEATISTDSSSKPSATDETEQPKKKKEKRVRTEEERDASWARNQAKSRARGEYALCYSSASESEDDETDATLSDSDNDSLFNEKLSTEEAPPKTPERVNVFSEKSIDALAKARSEAEKYKPKTPSGLRATSRLSSSPASQSSIYPPPTFPSYGDKMSIDEPSYSIYPPPTFPSYDDKMSIDEPSYPKPPNLLPKKSNIAVVALKDVMKASGPFNTEVPAETTQPGIFMTGAGPVNIFGTPIKSPAVVKPAPAATPATAATPAATPAAPAIPATVATPAAATAITAPAPTAATATIPPPDVTTAPAAVAQASVKRPFVNDGSIEYAIELARRVPPSALPNGDIKWPSIQASPIQDPTLAAMVAKLNNADWYDHVPEWARKEVRPDMFMHVFAPIKERLNAQAARERAQWAD